MGGKEKVGGMEVEGLISLAGFISSMYVHKIFHTNMLDIIINCIVIQEKNMIRFRLKNHRARVLSGWGHLVEGAPPPQKKTQHFFLLIHLFSDWGRGLRGK